jgi:hypothetical protein
VGVGCSDLFGRLVMGISVMIVGPFSLSSIVVGKVGAWAWEDRRVLHKTL